jgi:hypothetical protein
VECPGSLAYWLKCALKDLWGLKGAKKKFLFWNIIRRILSGG